MSLALVVALAAVLGFFWFRSRQRRSSEPARETTVALDAFLRDALELELAEGVLGMTASTPEERRRLARTLANEPDAEIVSAIEDKVRDVELEFVRYAHENDVEVTVRVRYEGGKAGTTSKRFATEDVPASIRADFASKGATRVFRSWSFPWQRAVAL